MTLLEEHRDKYEQKGDCLIWTGCVSGKYGTVRVGQKVKKAHRLSYADARGDIPPGMVVDHICHNHRCVNPDHLRLATLSENARNRAGAQRGSYSGTRGVTWNEKIGKWRAVIWVDGRNLHLGYFVELDDAARAAQEAREQHYGLFAGKGGTRPCS